MRLRAGRTGVVAIWVGGLALLGGLASMSLLLGSAGLGVESVVSVLGHHLLGIGPDPDPVTDAIVWSLRAPRTVVAALVGAALALAGAVTQGLFRNALATPSIIGASEGAALGAVVALSWGLADRTVLGLPLLAIVGSFAAMFLVVRIASDDGGAPIATLLLAGVALSAFLSAINTFLIARAWEEHEAARRIAFWMMGGVADRGWVHVGMVAPGLVLGGLVAIAGARDLDRLLEGEEMAGALGVDVEAAKRRLLAAAALLVGAAVAVSGVIGFVGLIVPHVVRLLVGPRHLRLLPASALTGAWLVVGADTLARTVIAPRELHLGVVTAFLGAPFFLFLLRRRRREWLWL